MTRFFAFILAVALIPGLAFTSGDEVKKMAGEYAAAVRSITRLVSNLTEEELVAICRIEEPETEKVAEIPRMYRAQHDYRH